MRFDADRCFSFPLLVPSSGQIPLSNSALLCWSMAATLVRSPQKATLGPYEKSRVLPVKNKRRKTKPSVPERMETAPPDLPPPESNWSNVEWEKKREQERMLSRERELKFHEAQVLHWQQQLKLERAYQLYLQAKLTEQKGPVTAPFFASAPLSSSSSSCTHDNRPPFFVAGGLDEVYAVGDCVDICQFNEIDKFYVEKAFIRERCTIVSRDLYDPRYWVVSWSEPAASSTTIAENREALVRVGLNPDTWSFDFSSPIVTHQLVHSSRIKRRARE